MREILKNNDTSNDVAALVCTTQRCHIFCLFDKTGKLITAEKGC